MIRTTALLSLIIGCLLAAVSANALDEGDRAPEFSAPSLTDEGNIALDEYLGFEQAPGLVNFSVIAFSLSGRF